MTVHALASPRPQAAAPTIDADCGPRFVVAWARLQDDLRAAQRLRRRVFGAEFGARFDLPPDTAQDLDVDRFDDFCEHLVVRTLPGAHDAPAVIGTYRLLTPEGARRAGGLYADTEFDLHRLAPLRPRLVELGRSCVDPAWRSGPVILALWTALTRFMHERRLDAMIGCASVGLADGGLQASALWLRLQATAMVEPRWRVVPLRPLPLVAGAEQAAVEPPPLIRGYLRCNARVLGAPAWDRDFNTADLPLMARLAELPARFRGDPSSA